MLGRVRASPASSLELLEMERLPSKMIKHDSLSIYESTLLKLKQGSQCNLTCDMATNSPEEAMTPDTDSSSIDSSPNLLSNFQSSKGQGNTNLSILHLFSKYNSSRKAWNSNDTEAMIMETGSSSSSSSSIPYSLSSLSSASAV